MASCSFSFNPKQDVMCKIKSWLVDEKKHIRYYHDWNDKEVRLWTLSLCLILPLCNNADSNLHVAAHTSLQTIWSVRSETFAFVYLHRRSKCWTNTCFWHPNRWFTLLTSLKKTTSGRRINGKCLSFLAALDKMCAKLLLVHFCLHELKP